MSVCTHCEGTLDDILHGVFSALLEQGVPVAATRGDTLELHAVALKLTNPLARLSRSEERRIVFSCLGELCWYLSGSDELAFIKPYIKRYEKEAVGGRVHSAYGPRLFGPPPPYALRSGLCYLQCIRRRRIGWRCHEGAGRGQ